MINTRYIVIQQRNKVNYYEIHIMNLQELYEGTEPRMPGAPSGVKVMTPQQFVARSNDTASDEEVTENESNDLAPGTKVRIPYKGRMVNGTIIRYEASKGGYSPAYVVDIGEYESKLVPAHDMVKYVSQDIAEHDEHLARIRKLSGLDEAFKLPIQGREFGGQEFQDYLTRIKGTPDIDKKTGLPKKEKDRISKKTGEVIPGAEKYVSGKLKTDKYKMPYIHRSDVITYLGPDGKTFSEDAIKRVLAERPKKLLKQNEKMKHSNGEFEQFYNVGFAALTGIALDEETNKLMIVNTCPGAGACKVTCFAMKGNKVMFSPPWKSDGRILTYLLNDPEGFATQLSSEIAKEAALGKKGDKNFPNGWQVTIRWHDAGDFFSPEYLDLAFKMAAKHPDVKFYAYTKVAGAMLAKKPDNFIINWSEGATPKEREQIKATDPNLEHTKNSRIVPPDLFWDLLKKKANGDLDKEDADESGKGGRWVTSGPDATRELKQRLAKEYGLSASSILSYDEYMAKRNSIPGNMKYNVIVAPGEGDISANDHGVLSTLLLQH